MRNIGNEFTYLENKKSRKLQIISRDLFSSVGLIALASAFLPTCAHATENGLTHYPINVNTVANGILPAPGTGMLDIYTQWYNATSMAGGDGKSKVPGFDSSISIFSPRLLYTLPKSFSLIPSFDSSATVGVIAPLLNLNLQLYNEHGHILGIGDLTLETDVSFNRPQDGYFSYFGVDAFLPTGSYNKNRLANLGYNYYSFEPQYNFTWFPNHRFEVDETAVFDLNTTNGSTHYHSGADFENDYALHYTAFPSALPNVNFGVQGYFYKQIQDDTVSGQSYNNGNRGQSFGIGPQITINMFHNRGGIDIKYTHQFAVRNQPKGEKIWVEFAIPFN